MKPHEMPATYANQVTVTATDAGWKLIFGESPDGSEKDVHHHTAVFLPLWMIPSFKRMVDEVMERTKANGQKSP